MFNDYALYTMSHWNSKYNLQDVLNVLNTIKFLSHILMLNMYAMDQNPEKNMCVTKKLMYETYGILADITQPQNSKFYS